ncbi:hypothetical protein D1631_01640 [Chryseobacterium nematophagum]|uniref:Uncharacterized protein n=1 Tax=Chryseobacterium nematophagum TaxID=2305228 RepID=A0A3M7TCI8_9FLAO|nr:hypothetical protein [Chryseobacterium nematophagum]RNA60724.1 hypothetical protein D1631_01640 [Chryseobacterium nematophagum]
MNQAYFIKKTSKVKIFNNGKVAIIICNMSLYMLATALFINSKTKQEIILSLVTMFCISSLFLIVVINVILNRLVFENYYLKKMGSALLVIENITEETGLTIKKIDESIYYSSYIQKKGFNTSIKKDVFFIIYDNRISLNIQNQEDSILLYTKDVMEKAIRKILYENSQKELSNS